MGGKQETLFYEVKPHVWRLEEDGQTFSVKRYRDRATADKVRSVHNRLQAVRFPYIAPLSDKGSGHLIIQPWLSDTRAVDYSKREDRRASLETLDALHATGEVIDWNGLSCLPRYDVLHKWNSRLVRFRRHEGLVRSYLGQEAFKEIVSRAEQALLKLRNVGSSHAPATLLHGDVVHHNLLTATDGTVYLIDFDLASAGSASTEIALWLHRVLPHVAYDAKALFDELPRLQKLDDEGLVMLQYPNEVLREWVHFAGLPDPGRRRIAPHLVPFTEQALSCWEDVCSFSDRALLKKR